MQHRYARVFRILALGAAMAILPLAGVANAQTVDQSAVSQSVTAAQARAQANLQNDLAQCQLAASGVKITGTNPGISVALPPGVTSPPCAASPTSVNPSAPAPSTPASTATTSSSSSSSSAGGGPTCAVATRALTRAETSLVNDFEISLAKAAANHTPAPAMSLDVAALIGC